MEKMVVSEDARCSSTVVSIVSGCDEEGEDVWCPSFKEGGAFMRQGGGR